MNDSTFFAERQETNTERETKTQRQKHKDTYRTQRDLTNRFGCKCFQTLENILTNNDFRWTSKSHGERNNNKITLREEQKQFNLNLMIKS